MARTDFLIFITHSREVLAVIIGDVAACLSGNGLRPNSGKCTVQSNTLIADAGTPLRVGTSVVEMVAARVGFSVSGVALTLDGRMEAEFENCIRVSWAKCFRIWLWPWLRKRDSSLTKRMQLHAE